MTEQKKPKWFQINIRVSLEVAEVLEQWAAEAKSSSSTVARDLLLAAIQQAQATKDGRLPPYLMRFYGMTREQEEEE